jgi:hypothetical protein
VTRGAGVIRSLCAIVALSIASGASGAWGRSGDPASANVTDWYAEREVYYKIFVPSFADSNGDRIGDLRGIERHHDAALDADPTVAVPSQLFREPIRRGGPGLRDLAGLPSTRAGGAPTPYAHRPR